MITGATESSFKFLSRLITLPDDTVVDFSLDRLLLQQAKNKILWLHCSYDQPSIQRLSKTYDQLSRIVCVSQWQKDGYVKYLNIPSEKITVIPNGGNDLFTFSENKSKVLIYTSTPFRGLKYLPQIFKRVREKHPDVRLKVFSSMKLYDQNSSEGIFEPYIDELKTTPGVEYHLPVDHEELAKHLKDAAIFCYPNTWEETSCVSLIEAMRCGCYPILSDIGALPETSAGYGAIVPMSGCSNPEGWEPDEMFIDNFVQTVVETLDLYDNERDKYNVKVKKISDYAIKNHDWLTISKNWKAGVLNMSEQKSITVPVVTAEQAAYSDEYLNKVFDTIFQWEEEDFELAQGRTNFQIEKFFLLEQHTIPAAFHSTLKNRRVMAEGLMQKIIEIKQGQREFDYRWKDKPKDKPIEYKAPDGRTSLQWYDLDAMQHENYMRSSNLEIKDRVQQIEFFDKILNKLVEMNGGKPVTKEQFEAEDAEYWKRRFSDQALDEMISRKTGISIGNLHSMRRSTAPTLVSGDVNRVDEFPSLADALTEEGSIQFALELQKNVMDGIKAVTGRDPNEPKLGYTKDETKQVGYGDKYYKRPSEPEIQAQQGLKFYRDK